MKPKTAPRAPRFVGPSGSTTPGGQYILFVDTFMDGRMSDRAKLFKTGGSQAVRLPKGYRFEGQREVLIYRSGRRVILEPIEREWSQDFLDLAGSAEEFPYPADLPDVDTPPELD